MVSFRSDPLNRRRFRLISEGSALSGYNGSSDFGQFGSISLNLFSFQFHLLSDCSVWLQMVSSNFQVSVSDFKGVSSGTGWINYTNCKQLHLLSVRTAWVIKLWLVKLKAIEKLVRLLCSKHLCSHPLKTAVFQVDSSLWFQMVQAHFRQSTLILDSSIRL